MRSVIIALCVLVQLVVLLTMAYSRESIIDNGERIYLRTAPIDPRDPFRGDFVRLNYAMNNTDSVVTQWNNPETPPARGDKVYATLSETFDSVYQAEYITDVEPESGLYIQGRVTSTTYRENRPQFLKFGIEQFFIQQGQGIAIENKQGVRGGLQVPLEMEIAVSKSGTALITGSRWSPLGIEMQLLSLNSSTQRHNDSESESIEELAGSDQPEAALRIRLQNTSSESVTINNPGENCGFSIIPANPNSNKHRAAYSKCDTTLPMVLLTLNPDEDYVLDIDLANPRWHIQSDAGIGVDMRGITTNDMFRIVFRSIQTSLPDQKELPDLWQGTLPSQAFNARGRVD